MQEMMRQMEGLADNSDFQNMLEGMMSQLMSKELLYEPMKDLAAKVSDDLQFQSGFLNNHWITSLVVVPRVVGEE